MVIDLKYLVTKYSQQEKKKKKISVRQPKVRKNWYLKDKQKLPSISMT